MYEIARENFDSLIELRDKLRKRQKNENMRYEERSCDVGEKSFFGTENYEEAEEMMLSGCPEIAEKIKTETEIKLKEAKNAVREKARPRMGIEGYAPCVPAAIIGLPESMIKTEKTKEKTKAVHIKYLSTGLCDVSTDSFIKAGVTLLSAIEIMEKNGISTKIDLCFKASFDRSRKELTSACVKIKDYNERYSAQKISFPIAHTSMFRRIGFRWLETTTVTKGDYRGGYGHTPSYTDKMKEQLKDSKDEIVISREDIEKMGYNVEKLLQKIGVK